MQWCEKYSIGIDEIDRQHRILLDFVTQVERAVNHGGRWSEIYFPLVRLREYTRTHFGLEESLMRMSDYSDTERHVEEHHNILQKMQSLENRSLRTDVTSDMTHFLRDQLVSHFLYQDMGYAYHFANGGFIAVRNHSSTSKLIETELLVAKEMSRIEDGR